MSWLIKTFINDDNLCKNLINPFMSNGISHCYQLDQSIVVLRVVGGSFHFYSNF